jgi:hypothetical protein
VPFSSWWLITGACRRLNCGMMLRQYRPRYELAFATKAPPTSTIWLAVRVAGSSTGTLAFPTGRAAATSAGGCERYHPTDETKATILAIGSRGTAVRRAGRTIFRCSCKEFQNSSLGSSSPRRWQRAGRRVRRRYRIRNHRPEATPGHDVTTVMTLDLCCRSTGCRRATRYHPSPDTAPSTTGCPPPGRPGDSCGLDERFSISAIEPPG